MDVHGVSSQWKMVIVFKALPRGERRSDRGAGVSGVGTGSGAGNGWRPLMSPAGEPVRMSAAISEAVAVALWPGGISLTCLAAVVSSPTWLKSAAKGLAVATMAANSAR